MNQAAKDKLGVSIRTTATGELLVFRSIFNGYRYSDDASSINAVKPDDAPQLLQAVRKALGLDS